MKRLGLYRGGIIGFFDAFWPRFAVQHHEENHDLQIVATRYFHLDSDRELAAPHFPFFPFFLFTIGNEFTH